MITKNNIKLSGDYIAGFVDGEGCFGLQYRKDEKRNRPNNPAYYSWKVQFTIVAREDEKELFERIKNLFGCGAIYKSNGEIHYAVQNIDELHNIIIPFFNKYKLEGKKKNDFLLWVEAVKIIFQNKNDSINIQKGFRGFVKKPWSVKDFERILEIHNLMQKYKSKRPQGLKHIKVAQGIVDSKKLKK